MKKQFTSMLAIMLGVSLVTGCGSAKGDIAAGADGSIQPSPDATAVSGLVASGKDGDATDASDTTGAQADQISAAADLADQSGTVNLLANIKNKYASAASDSKNDFNEPVYNLANDYVFTFDCNQDAMSSVHDNIFGVYTTIDYENPDKYIRNCASCYAENGQIIVEPGSVDKFYDIKDDTLTADTDTFDSWKVESDGTWGSLNKLYLVQKYDLQTGEKLDRPIITPFSIHHEIESTTVKQKIDSNNNYYLEWSPVRGASSYLIYQLDGESFDLVGKTSETSLSADQLMGQLHSDKWSDIVNKELQENGYDTTTSERLFMNADLHNHQDSKFAVVAVKDGKTSGISNIVDPKEIADLLPYSVAQENREITISSITDIPAYVTMTTVNDKTMQMLIDYHGCSAKAEDENSSTIYLYPKVYRTDLSPFRLTIHGMKFSDFAEQNKVIGERQDKIAATMPTEKVDTEINVSNVPNEEEENGYTEKIEKRNSDTQPEPSQNPDTIEEPTDPEEPVTPDEPTDPEEPSNNEEPETPEEPANPQEPGDSDGPAFNNEPETPEEPTEPETPEEPTEPEEPETPEEPATPDEPTEPEEPAEPSDDTTSRVNPSATNELLSEVADMVSTNISLIQQESGVSLDNVIFADSALEEWVASCLIARSEYIPVPVSEFPEGADVEGTANKIYAVYRQNPTSGVLINIQYSYDYQTFIITYADESTDRLNKTVEELKKAREVADSVAGGLSTEYDKVVALNDYFCTNASYDESSMSTDVDVNSLTQPFIDAHTPYGILCNNYGVCESYSEAMALTGRLAGLNVIMETGDLYGAGGHEWNRVSIDGNWCILDITNNDNESVPNGLCNITDGMATQLLIPDNTSYLFNAAASTDAYEYYRMNNNYADTVSDLVSKLEEQLSSNDIARIRCSESMTEEDVVSALQQVYGEGYSISDAYYIYNIAVVTK